MERWLRIFQIYRKNNESKNLRSCIPSFVLYKRAKSYENESVGLSGLDKWGHYTKLAKEQKKK